MAPPASPRNRALVGESSANPDNPCEVSCVGVRCTYPTYVLTLGYEGLNVRDHL